MKDVIWLGKHLLRTALLFASAWGLWLHFPLVYSEFADVWHSPRTWLMRKIDLIPDRQLRYRISDYLPGVYRLTWICQLTDGGKPLATLLPGATVETKQKPFDIRCGGRVVAIIYSFSKVEISRNSSGDPVVVLQHGSALTSHYPEMPVEVRQGEWSLTTDIGKEIHHLSISRAPSRRINSVGSLSTTVKVVVNEPPLAALKAEGVLFEGLTPEQVEFRGIPGLEAAKFDRVSFLPSRVNP